MFQTIAEGMYQLAIKDNIPGFADQLHASFKAALAKGVWNNTYGGYSPEAYFVSNSNILIIIVYLIYYSAGSPIVHDNLQFLVHHDQYHKLVVERQSFKLTIEPILI